MTSVGWVGLGKLGAPCAAALAQYGGHTVWGYDVRGTDAGEYDWASLPPVQLVDAIGKIVSGTDEVVYVAVQTPHDSRYGGETIVPDEPREFEYAYLVNAVRAVCDAALEQRKPITLVIVSTVLPGTFDRRLRSLLNGYVTPVYHPFFIAMGTVVEDFVQPEMTLFGVDTVGDEAPVYRLYAQLHAAHAHTMSITSAELTKVAYNTFISTKIVFANLMAELAEHTGADVDDVTNALALATDRIISPRYLTAGMGDGGACHPRDNVALSALAQRYGLSSDLMGFLTRARERQTEWFADVIEHWLNLSDLPLVLLGRSYKPGVYSTDGSPAILLANVLTDRGVDLTQFDHDASTLSTPHVYFVATKHDEYRSYEFCPGSVVIDPFGYLNPEPDARVTLVRPGRRR